MATNIFMPLVWHAVCVTPLAPRILKLLLDFWKNLQTPKLACVSVSQLETGLRLERGEGGGEFPGVSKLLY